MSELDYHTPKNIPKEILAYGKELVQLKPGRSGKIGSLSLKMEYSPEAGKTVIREQYSKVPLSALKSLYLEETLPAMAYVYIMSPSGGILQGDRYRMDFTLAKNAQAHLTTQGATRIYRMDLNYATQMINFDVDDGCYLEYVPDQMIPFRESRFYQDIEMKVHDNATLLYSEMIVPGRVASNEEFEYDIFFMKTQARNQNGALRFTDVFMLEPKKNNLNELGILGKRSVVGSVYILTKKEYATQLVQSINLALKKFPNIDSGATTLPHNSGVLVRMLGDGANEMREEIYEIVNITRKAILNSPFSGVRKY